MAGPPKQRRKLVSVRMRPELVDEMRQLIRDHAGAPLYLNPGAFIESAILHEIERIRLGLAAQGAAGPSAPGENHRTRSTGARP